MQRILGSALFVVAVLGSAGAARAQDNYGALAYSSSSGAEGYSSDYGSQAEAESTALDECSAHVGGCEVVMWFRNACGALAVGPDGWGSAWGEDQQVAERKALNECANHSGSCSIRRWACTTR